MSIGSYSCQVAAAIDMPLQVINATRIHTATRAEVSEDSAPVSKIA